MSFDEDLFDEPLIMNSDEEHQILNSDDEGDGLDTLTPLEGCEKLIRDYNKKRKVSKQEFTKYLKDYVGEYDEIAALKMYDDENRWTEMKISGEKFMKILKKLRYQLVVEQFALSLGGMMMNQKQFNALMQQIDSPCSKRDLKIIWRYIDKESDEVISLHDLRLFVRNIATKTNVEKIRAKVVSILKKNHLDRYFASDRFLDIVKAVSDQEAFNPPPKSGAVNVEFQPKKVQYYNKEKKDSKSNSNHKYQEFLTAIHHLAATKYFNMDDFSGLTKDLKLKISDRDSRVLFRYLDTEKDNSIEFEHFRGFMKKLAIEKKVENIRQKIIKALGKKKTKLLNETVILYREPTENEGLDSDAFKSENNWEESEEEVNESDLEKLIEKLSCKDVKKTLKQLRHYKRLFNIMDDNVNRMIDINEFGRVMTDHLGVRPLAVSRDIFRTVDVNMKNHLVSTDISMICRELREHFDPVIAKRARATSSSKNLTDSSFSKAGSAKRSFEEALQDWHDAGELDMRKFKQTLNDIGIHQLQEPDIKTLFKTIDHDKNHTVKLPHFQEFLQVTYGRKENLERIKQHVLLQLNHDKVEKLLDFNSVLHAVQRQNSGIGTAELLAQLESVSPEIAMQRIEILQEWKDILEIQEEDEESGAIGLDDYILFMKQTVGIRDEDILAAVFNLKDQRDGDSSGLLLISQIDDLVQDLIVHFQSELKNNSKRDLIDKVNSAIADFLVGDECTEKMFRKFLKKMGAKVTEREVRIVFRHLDKEKNLALTHHAVYQYIKHKTLQSQVDKVRDKILKQWTAKDEDIIQIFFDREPMTKPLLKSRQSELPNLLKNQSKKTWRGHRAEVIAEEMKKEKKRSSKRQTKKSKKKGTKAPKERKRIEKPIVVGAKKGQPLLPRKVTPKKEKKKKKEKEKEKPKPILKNINGGRSVSSDKSISFEAMTSFIEEPQKFEAKRRELLDIDEYPLGEKEKALEEQLRQIKEERQKMAEMEKKLERYESELNLTPEEYSKKLEEEELAYEERLQLQWKQEKEELKAKHKRKLDKFKKNDEYKKIGLKKALQVREKQKLMEFFQNEEEADETSDIHLDTEILIEIGRTEDDPSVEYTPMLNKWNLARVRGIVEKVMESKEVYHIVDYLQKRMTNLTGILTYTAMLSTSKKNVTEGDLESVVIVKLNSLCKDLGVEPKDIIWSKSAFEIDIDERSRCDEDDEAASEYIEFAHGKCEHAFDEHSMNDHMDENMFYKCVQELGLDWSELESQTYFEVLDAVDVGTISRDTFFDGMVRHVLISFNHTVRASGATLLNLGVSDPEPIRELDAFMPLIITAWKDGYGFVNALEGWVKADEVVKSIRRVAEQNMSRITNGEVVVGRARTLTPIAHVPNIPGTDSTDGRDSFVLPQIIPDDLPQTLLNQTQMEAAKEHLSLTSQLRSGFEAMVGVAPDATVHSSAKHLQRRSEQLLIKLETHSQSGLPNLYRLIHDGKNLVVNKDLGSLKEDIYAMCYNVNDSSYHDLEREQFKSMILDLLLISARFCHLFHYEVYHVDDNLFIVLLTNSDNGKVNMFRSKLILHLQQRMERNWGVLNLQTSITKRKTNERFGIFVDRAVSELYPSSPKGSWLAAQSQHNNERLLYELVSDPKSFNENAQAAKCAFSSVWNEKDVCQCIRKLMKRGATYDYVDQDGHDVLMYAAKEGFNDVIKELLRQPRRIKKRRNAEGMTLIMLAIQSKRIANQNLSELIPFDFGLEARDKHGRDLVVHCMNTDQMLLAEFFILRGVPDLRPVLTSMIEQDDLPGILKLQRHRGLDLTVARVDPEGATILCTAAQNGAINIIRHLLDISDVVSDYQGMSPLHYAALWGQPEAAKALLEHGVDPNIRDNLGETPLLAVSGNGNIPFCKVLLDSGANINLSDRKGTTALIRCAAYGYYQLSQFLLREGADPEIRDTDGNDAVSMARRHGHDLRRLGLTGLVE